MESASEGMISEAQHEKEMTRMETANKRWFIAFIIVLVMLFGSNAAWIIYENQFQDVVISQDADVEGSNYMNATGEFNYGTRESDNQN